MYHVFVNPASRSGSGAATWLAAKEIFDKKDIPYRIHFTKKGESIKKEYEKILRDFPERPVRIIALGGDGTLNQCINGITDLENTELSLIKNGSGNDFAHNKKLPQNMEDIVDGIIDHRHTMQIDVGLLTCTEGCLPDGRRVKDGKHRFLVSSGYGYDASTCYNANNSKLKKVLGKLTYIHYGVKNIFTTKLSNITITVDNNSPRRLSKVFFLAAMNQPVEGGGIPMVPNASDTDGKLSYCVFHSLKRLQAMTYIPRLYAKKHIGLRGVETFEGTKVQVESDIPQFIHYDGETPGMYKKAITEIIGKIKFVY